MTLTANGFEVDESPSVFGQLLDSTAALDSPASLKRLMTQHGYLYFPGLLKSSMVMKAREELLLKFAMLGEVDDRYPLDDAVAGDRHGVSTANLRAFSQSLRTGYWYLQVTSAPEILAINQSLLDGDVRCFDFRWPRLVRPGESCGFHCDGPYMARGTSTERIFTAWIPLGRVHPHEGGLMLLEGSHQNEILHAGYLNKDADEDGLTWLTDNPNELRQKYGSRWLTADFEPGDVLCFSMHTIHGSLDNLSQQARCRLSSDTRYQRTGEAADHRWNGSTIEAHGGNRVFYPGLGKWQNVDFTDEWKHVDEHGRLILPKPLDANSSEESS